MLGREVNIPTSLVFGPPVDEAERSSLEDFVSKMTQNLSLAPEVARERLKTAQKVMKRDYDVRTRVKTFKKGDLVYYLNSQGVRNSAHLGQVQGLNYCKGNI